MPTILPDQNVKKVAVASKSQFIDAYTSHKLAVLSFICSLAVILLHSYNWRFNADSNLTVDFFIENIFSNGLCRMAVPFFFFRAGYLFFINVPEKFDWQWFKKKFQTRFFSIFVPFVLWCILGFIIDTPWKILLSVRHNTNYVFFLNQSSPLITIFKAVFLGIGHDPLVHLWFLRRLMLFVLLSPIVLLLVRTLRLTVFLVVSIILVCAVKIFDIQWLGYINGDMFSFLFGSALAINRIRLNNSNRITPGLTCFLLWVMFVIFLFLSCRHINYPTFLHYLLIQIRNFWGIFAVWMVYDSLKAVARKYNLRCNFFPNELISLSFFIYCCHIPVLGIIEFVFALKAPFEIIRYFGTFSVTTIYAISLGWFLCKFFPKLYSILSGARS